MTTLKMSKSGLDAKYERRRDDSRLAQYCILLALYNSSYYKRELYFFWNVGLGHLYITQKNTIFFFNQPSFSSSFTRLHFLSFPFLEGQHSVTGINTAVSSVSRVFLCVVVSPMLAWVYTFLQPLWMGCDYGLFFKHC